MAIESFNQYQKYFELTEADGYPIHIVQLGDLALPSGKIIASDPFFSNQQLPFSKTVPSGSYPVSLAIATVDESHFRVGLARVKFEKQAAVSWELAVTSDVLPDELAMLGPYEFIGYEVNIGLGMFIDAEINTEYTAALQTFYQKNENGNYYTDVLSKEFAHTSGEHPFSQHSGDWNVHYPTGNESKNALMFAAGWGEGLYPSYWGLDGAGNIVELISDFIVFGDFN